MIEMKNKDGTIVKVPAIEVAKMERRGFVRVHPIKPVVKPVVKPLDE